MINNIPPDIPTDVPLSWVIISGIICVLFLLWVTYQFYEGWYGKKCPHCKCRSEKWIQWHEMRDEKEFTGHIWCPVCYWKQFEGFSDRTQI